MKNSREIINQRCRINYANNKEVREKRAETNKKYYSKNAEKWKQYAKNRREKTYQKLAKATNAKKTIEGMEMNDKLTLNVQELSEALGIGRVTAYQLINSEKFYPAFRMGKKILINKKKLQEWLDEQCMGERHEEEKAEAKD